MNKKQDTFAFIIEKCRTATSNPKTLGPCAPDRVPYKGPMTEQEIVAVAEYIDSERSMTNLMRLLRALDPMVRKAVILQRLGASTAQYSWSFFARQFNIPRSEWPPNPLEKTRISEKNWG